MRAVNLLPRDAERQARQGGRAPLFVGAGGVAAVVAASLVLTLSASATVSDRTADLEATEASIAALRRDGPGVISAGALGQERSDRVAALSAALGSRVAIDRLLRDIAYVLPEDAWLTGLTAAAPAGGATAASPAAAPPPQGAATSQGVEIQGATYSQASVARVLARLSLLPTLADVRLGTSARVDLQSVNGGDGKPTSTPKPKTVVTFVIVASVAGGGS